MNGFTNNWDSYLKNTPEERNDVYFQEAYVRLYETESEKANCFVYQDNGHTLIFPFLERNFRFGEDGFRDFETAYGYGGPICDTNDITFIEKALKSFKEKAIERNFVCGFIRFHPILQNWLGFDRIGSVINDRNTIAIDLQEGIEAAWMNEIHTKNRNVIKKGEKLGLEFIADYDFTYLTEFKRLYDSTMDKLNAEAFYYFNDEYYKRLKEGLTNRFLAVVKYADKIVASAIIFFNGPYGHYHLAGSDASSLNLAPNNFLLWNAAKELERRGVKLFHIGGGTDGTEDNSLYQYKKKFSKSSYQFSLGKIVFNSEVYSNLCNEWEKSNPNKVEDYRNILMKYKY